MQVMFINNTGGGFADHVSVEPGTTIEAFLDDHLSDYQPDANVESALTSASA